jgi:hypothetical protein
MENIVAGLQLTAYYEYRILPGGKATGEWL